MIFFLFIAITTAIITRTAYREYDGFWDRVGLWFLLLILGALVNGLAVLLMNIGIDMFSAARVEKHVVRPIVSLRTDKDHFGSFVLGCGSSGSYEQYYFMYDLGEGRYQRDTEGTHSTVLREFDGEKPNLAYDVMINYNPKMEFWWPRSLTFSFRQRQNIVLTVPKGTLIQKFEVK